jgi:hypothetical protein
MAEAGVRRPAGSLRTELLDRSTSVEGPNQARPGPRLLVSVLLQTNSIILEEAGSVPAERQTTCSGLRYRSWHYRDS